MFKLSTSISTLARSFAGVLALTLMSSVALAADFDINGDGCVSTADSECLVQGALLFPIKPDCMDVWWSQADLNGDRTIDVVDVQVLALEIAENGSTCDCSDDPEIVDVNGDCAVDGADIDCYIEVVLWEMADPSSPPPACMAISVVDADYNGDGSLNVVDLMRLINYID